MRRRLLVLLIGTLVGSAFAAAPVYADLSFVFIGLRPVGPPPPPLGGFGSGCFLGGSCFFFSNISPTATLRAGGRQAVLSGPIRCKPGLTVSLRLTLTQRSTAAIAQLGLRGPCPTRLRGFRAAVTSRTQPLVAGGAFACVLGVVQRGETYVDANQWCRRVTLVAGT
jgi:hypothetical protein